MFAGKKSAQIREILISESAWEEMTCLFAPSLKECRISGAVSRAYPCAVKKPAWYEAGLRIFVVIRTDRLNQRQRCRQLRYHCFHRSCRLRPAS
ncbi:hypothetical protein E4179_11250 [Citrobacter freundii]|nr:hypothetical protein E4179_11250 [Citrobacter freundii]QGJ46870.1 hypothetical protein E4177_15025 [Citrobacter freundii]QGJ50557.1 hypothetical protein E4174_06475 [Citrobacter freundii]